MNIQFRKIIKKMSSIKMAVVSISLIAIITAIGTFVEAKYDATAAQKLVYQSIWMQIIMLIFATTLIAVIVDRYPWKSKHLSFICAHIGILFVILGQSISNNYGLDGSMRVGIGESNRFAVISNKTDLTVYSSFDGANYTKVFEREVDFFLQPPSEKNPIKIAANGSEIILSDYQRYVVPSTKVTASDLPLLGAGLRFQIHNERVNVVEWLVQRKPMQIATHDLGPAQIHLGPIPNFGKNINEIYLEPIINSEKIKYAVFKKDKNTAAIHGVIEEGGIIQTGWMGLELKILRFFPKAIENWELKQKETPNPMTTSAAKVIFQGQEKWVLLNDTLKLFASNATYIVTYANRRVDIGFPIALDQFLIDRYQGTARAASYRSFVSIPDVGGVEISMNEPLKHKGLTIYQASFEDGPQGQPKASIFSINHDPGRPLKYFGSFLMSLGILLLFYFRKKNPIPKSESR